MLVEVGGTQTRDPLLDRLIPTGAKAHFVLVVPATSPYKSLAEPIQANKGKAEPLNLASDSTDR